MINSFSAHPRESGGPGQQIEDQKQAVLDSRFRGNKRSVVRPEQIALKDFKRPQQLKYRDQHDQAPDRGHQATRRHVLDDPAAEWRRQHAAKDERKEVVERHGAELRKNVVAAATVTKNSAVLTEPTE